MNNITPEIEELLRNARPLDQIDTDWLAVAIRAALDEDDETQDEASIRRHGFVMGGRTPAGRKPMIWDEEEFDSDRADLDEW